MTEHRARYPHVAAAVFGTPWLIHPDWMAAIVEVLEHRLEGARRTEAEIADRLAVGRQTLGPRTSNRRAGAVAVIPIYGVLAQRASYFEETSTGGTSVQALQAAFREALADPEVASILFDVDSPGGHVSGIPEFGAEIRAARGQKPMAAISNTLMASAAYWLASQTDEIIVSPSSMTGSIGVVMGHVDYSKQQEMLGIQTTLIHYGEHKVEDWPQLPLSEDARAHLQALVDETGHEFDAAVGKGRGLTAARVHADFGQGRVFNPAGAVAIGMADRVDTYEGTIQRLASGKVKSRGGAGATSPVLSLEEIASLPVDQRAEAYAEGIVAGRFSANAVRTQEGLEALPEGDDVPSKPEPVDDEPDQSIEIARARARAHSR